MASRHRDGKVVSRLRWDLEAAVKAGDRVGQVSCRVIINANRHVEVLGARYVCTCVCM
jgi:hypothetical protein